MTHGATERMLDRIALLAFLRESNAIEGIYRKPTKAEVEETEAFLALAVPRVSNLAGLVKVYQPDALLRDNPFLNVRVGDHIAPKGGDAVVDALKAILADLPTADPWDLHARYETLHPFTDGNGRSGRALWAWQMVRRQDGLPLGFLHQWYYQTLSRSLAALVSARADGERDMRERAAKVAEGFRCGVCGMDGKAAASIRLLKDTGPEPIPTSTKETDQ